MSVILGLDTATRTGWALVGKDGVVIESGVEDFAKRRGESNGSMFLRFRHWLHQMIADNAVTFVAYEQAHHRGGAATEIGVNLTGRVQEVCAEKGIEYATIHTSTLKKYATGNGRAEKTEMMAKASELLGRTVLSDDEADSIFVSIWAWESYG